MRKELTERTPIIYAIDKMMDIAQQGEEDNELRELTLIPLRHINELVTELPTIDTVEVVRCEDCKHWGDNGHCDAIDIWIRGSGDFFCSRGERK